MGDILKGWHNNHVGKLLCLIGEIILAYQLKILSGELEITFAKDFCRVGNVSALMQDDLLPDALQPYITKIRSLYDPPPPPSKHPSNSKVEPLKSRIMNLLIKRLNSQNSDSCTWLLPEQWATLAGDDCIGFAPTPARASFHKHIKHNGVNFSPFSDKPDDSFIVFKKSNGVQLFGRISSVFTHRRSPTATSHIVDTWVYVQQFPELPSDLYNPFKLVDFPFIQAHLCLWTPTVDQLIRLEEVVAHCTWLMFKPGEISEDLKVPTVGLLRMER